MRRRSRRFVTTLSLWTPRSCSISGREIGCRYATIVSVSTAARDKRLLRRRRWRLTSTPACSGRVTRRQPPPTSTTERPRPGTSLARRKASRAARASSGLISRTSAIRSSGSGASEAKRMASSWPSRSGVTTSDITCPPASRIANRRLTGCAFDDDLAEQLPLLGARLLEPHQLEDREERDHHVRPRGRGAEERREQDVPGLLEDADDHGHPLEERRA